MANFKFTALVWGSLFVFALLQLSEAATIKKCSSPIVRKEWRALTAKQQQKYLSAVKCLQNIPAKTCAAVPGAISRFDDFQGVHIRQTDFIHFVGHFQAWHRYYLATYEKSLREECGYTGAQPYWDWTLDSASNATFLAAPVFANSAFGGNGPYVENGTVVGLEGVTGRTGGGCVPNGSFKDLELHLGPGTNLERNNQCLTRDIAFPIILKCLTATAVDKALAAENYQAFDMEAEGGTTPEAFTYHAGGHLGIGGAYGTIADIYASPGDPLFYLHHANMDRIWWMWQSQDLATRLTDISGPIVQFGYPFSNNTSGGNVTLDFKIHLNELAGNVTLEQMMNIKGGDLCYDYA
ncbi:uncharacterized protein LAJ45_08286 [Morchella importuna]|uniref:uncharacterized protein n=1 Tax=Morchella importuna TaxID=1174673 RepID=UPI001E8D4FBE|nr:uncharacterized protein LAJ45_08286 [Morchella importuna]KAH8147820.1 hypothetical protein LAJ45_08286 [Morchella importuna]